MEQAGVQLEVLPDGQFAIEREGLRHIAHPLAGGDILRVDRLAEQPGFTFAGGQQAGEHLHGGGFAAAVGAEEAEDFTAGDAEINVVDGNKVAKAHGQAARFDGDLFLTAVARWDNYRPMRLTLCFWQQGDKRLLQGLAAGLGFELCGAAGRQHLAGVHRHQPVKALGLFHVGGGHQHAHRRLALANTVDKLPELRPGEGIDAGGRFIKDQQLRIVDQRAAQAELLLHPTGEFSGGAIAKRRQPGTLQQLVDAQFALGFIVAEQAGEEVDVFIHRESVIEVFPQPLRHPRDFRTHLAAVMHIAHIAAKHHHVPLLDGPRPGDQRKQARFADAVRANQANHTPCRDRQTDIAQRDGGAKLLTNVFQQGDGGRGILRR